MRVIKNKTIEIILTLDARTDSKLKRYHKQNPRSKNPYR